MNSSNLLSLVPLLHEFPKSPLPSSITPWIPQIPSPYSSITSWVPWIHLGVVLCSYILVPSPESWPWHEFTHKVGYGVCSEPVDFTPGAEVVLSPTLILGPVPIHIIVLVLLFPGIQGVLFIIFRVYRVSSPSISGFTVCSFLVLVLLFPGVQITGCPFS